MRRLTTTLTKITEAETRLKKEAEALTKKRATLAKQRERMAREVQTAQYVAVGKLVEQMGLPIADLGALEWVLKGLGEDPKPSPLNHTMSNTSDVPSGRNAAETE